MKIDTLCFTNVTLVAHQETICSNGSLYDGKQFAAMARYMMVNNSTNINKTKKSPLATNH